MSLKPILAAARQNRDAFAGKYSEYIRTVISNPPRIGAKPGEGFYLILPIEEFGCIYQTKYDPKTPLKQQNEALERIALDSGSRLYGYLAVWENFAGLLEPFNHSFPRLTENAQKKFDYLQEHFGTHASDILDKDIDEMQINLHPLDGLGCTASLAADILNFRGEKVKLRDSELKPQKLLGYIQQSDLEGQLGAIGWLMTCGHKELETISLKAVFGKDSVYSLEQIEQVLQALDLPLEPLAGTIIQQIGPKECRFTQDLMCDQPYTDQLIATLEYIQSQNVEIKTIADLKDRKNPNYASAMERADELENELKILTIKRTKLACQNIPQDFDKDVAETVDELKNAIRGDTPERLIKKAKDEMSKHITLLDRVREFSRKFIFEPQFDKGGWNDTLIALQTLSAQPEELQQSTDWEKAVEWVRKMFKAKNIAQIQENTRIQILSLPDHRKVMFIKLLIEAETSWKDNLAGLKILCEIPSELQDQNDWKRAVDMVGHMLKQDGLSNEVRKTAHDLIISMGD